MLTSRRGNWKWSNANFRVLGLMPAPLYSYHISCRGKETFVLLMEK